MSKEVSVKAFACEKCLKTYTTLPYATRLDLSTEAARRAADECCAPRLCACGATIESRSWTACAPCRERNKLRRATVIDGASYTGPVHSDDVDGGWGEGYSPDLDALREWCADRDVPLPAYVHACEEVDFQLNADTILEAALDDHHEDAAAQIVDEIGLAKFLTVWNAKQYLKSYYPDAKFVIVLDPARFEMLISAPQEGKSQ